MFEFRDELFVECDEFAQPPGVFREQLSVLHVKPFEQLVAHLGKPGVVSQCMQGFDRQRLPVRKDLGLNETFAHVPGTEPERGHPDVENRLAGGRIG